MNEFMLIIGMIPFWFRFWQCINKGILQHNNAQFVNAGKYLSKLIIPVVGYYIVEHKFIDGGPFWYYFAA
jgi:hypothetical protein